MKMSTEKQFELMYQDMNSTLSDQKRAQFDLTRWLVTLQVGIAGFSFLDGVTLSPWFALVPLMAGLAALMLNYGFDRELLSHRRSLAEIRRKVGGDFEMIFADMVDRYKDGNKREWGSFFWIIGFSHDLIIVMASVTAAVVIWAGAIVG